MIQQLSGFCRDFAVHDYLSSGFPGTGTGMALWPKKVHSRGGALCDTLVAREEPKVCAPDCHGFFPVG
jgi:hypothetical protein